MSRLLEARGIGLTRGDRVILENVDLDISEGKSLR